MKNLFKKISAILIAAVMVLAMASTAFAADVTVTSTDIIVNNVGGANLSYIQVIKPSITTTTGWEFTSSSIAEIYKDAIEVKDDQAAIQKLINAATGKDDKATSTQIETALSNVIAAGGLTNAVGNNVTDESKKINVESAGVYAIKANDTSTPQAWTYSPMAAYVSFGSYNTTTGIPSTLEAEPVNAKRTPISIDKKSSETDNVTEIGKVETYTVTASVPYIPLSKDTKRYYKIKDTINGAEYVTKTVGEKKVVEITFTMGNKTESKAVEVTDNENGTQSFVLDLSDLVVKDGKPSNEFANATYTFTYQATVTKKKVNNSIIGFGENGDTPEYGGGESNLYTGKVTLTKYGEDKKLLAGAGFTVTKGSEKLKFREVTDKDGKVVKGQYEYDMTGKVEEVFTAEDGKLTISGLDVAGKNEDAIQYTFTEKTAPKGYSVNNNSKTTTAKLTEDKATGEITIDGVEITDTKLSALPSTGGMGTYLFTIIGVVVMAGAAGAFFISRRKGSEE